MSIVTIRPPTPADVDTIVDLINAASLAEGGTPDMTAAIIRGDWAETNFDLANNAWLALGADGAALGYETLFFEPGGKAEVDGYVHPAHKYQGIGTQLLQRAEARARAQMAADDRPALIIHGAIEAGNAAAQALFDSLGYSTVRHFWRMELVIDAPPPAPAWPAGIAVRAFRAEDERAVHATVQEAFRDHWGSSPAPFEEWRQAALGREDFDPALWFLAYDGAELAGVVLGYPRTAALGWVRNLSVRRPWRRRGLGLALLRQVFGAFYARGLRTAGLGVDAQNLSGATRLYERAGMTVAERYDHKEKQIGRTGSEKATERAEM